MVQPGRDIACVGLGYVGLSTALSFCEAGYDVVGVDVDDSIVDAINGGTAPVGSEHSDNQIASQVSQGRLSATTEFDRAVGQSNTYVLSVPTPVDGDRPDLSYVRGAARSVAAVLSPHDLVVLQSTVYPGCTRSVVIPELEGANQTAGEDFGISYVPERYSPGDEQSTRTPRLVGSIDDRWRAETIAVYEPIVESTVSVSSIEVAEAAKQIENIQRDVNVALVNEYKQILDNIDVDVSETLEAAATKWNFHRYEPRLGVGGHCIPVDPYYFMEAASEAGVDPALIRTARRTNERMPQYHFERLRSALTNRGFSLSEVTVAVLGVTYKPDVKDVRNSPALALLGHVGDSGATCRVFDPEFAAGEPIPQTGIQNSASASAAATGANALVLGVDHTAFEDIDFGSLVSDLAPPALLLDPGATIPESSIEQSMAETIDDIMDTSQRKPAH